MNPADGGEQFSGYFDWAATAPPDRDLVLESAELSLAVFGNPSSLHRAGKRARDKLEEARARLARAMGVPAGTLYFTSGGTEANHLPLLALLRRPRPAALAVSAIEHPSVREMAESLKAAGWRVDVVRSDSRGVITPEAVLDAVAGDTALVCVMAANNETGAIQPVSGIADALASLRGRRPLLHVDCVQAAGKIPLALARAGIDSAAFSAHKVGGMRGSGLLYLAKPFSPFARGGGQEGGIRSGTENLAGAWALSRCFERRYLSPEAERDNPAAYGRFLQAKRDAASFVARLRAVPGCTLIPDMRGEADGSPDADALYSPWIVQAAFRDVPGQAFVRALDAKGFAVSTGAACSLRRAGTTGARPILAAMGVPERVAANAVRFSFGYRNAPADIDALLGAVRDTAAAFGDAGGLQAAMRADCRQQCGRIVGSNADGL